MVTDARNATGNIHRGKAGATGKNTCTNARKATRKHNGSEAGTILECIFPDAIYNIRIAHDRIYRIWNRHIRKAGIRRLPHHFYSRVACNVIVQVAILEIVGLSTNGGQYDGHERKEDFLFHITVE